jgi:hypothetical protein
MILSENRLPLFRIMPLALQAPDLHANVARAAAIRAGVIARPFAGSREWDDHAEG